MEFEGSAYEFDAKFIGGPGDGLEDSVLSATNEPPLVTHIELSEEIATKDRARKLLDLFFNRKIEGRVAVYGRDEYDAVVEEETIVYRFIEILDFPVFCEKYKK